MIVMFHHSSTTCTLYTFKKRITKAWFFLEFEFDLLLRIGLLQYRLFLWGTDPQRRIRKLLAVLLNLTRRKHVNNDQKTKWILDGGGFSIPNLIISSSKNPVWPKKTPSHTTLQPTAKSKKAKGGDAKKALPPRRSKIWDDRVVKMSDHADLIVPIFEGSIIDSLIRGINSLLSQILKAWNHKNPYIVQPVCFSTNLPSINLWSHLEDHPVRDPPGSCDSIESRWPDHLCPASSHSSASEETGWSTRCMASSLMPNVLFYETPDLYSARCHRYIVLDIEIRNTLKCWIAVPLMRLRQSHHGDHLCAIRSKRIKSSYKYHALNKYTLGVH